MDICSPEVTFNTAVFYNGLGFQCLFGQQNKQLEALIGQHLRNAIERDIFRGPTDDEARRNSGLRRKARWIERPGGAIVADGISDCHQMNSRLLELLPFGHRQWRRNKSHWLTACRRLH